jgi:hypothetical protein
MSTELIARNDDASGAIRTVLQKLIDSFGHAGAVFSDVPGKRLSPEEAALWEIVNRTLSPTMSARYQLLSGKVREETLTAEEYEELQKVTDEVEKLHAERIKAILKLAVLRGETVKDLTASIGMEAPDG